MRGRALPGVLRTVIVAAVELVTYLLVRVLGIGGYRSGGALAVALILVAGGAVAFFFTRNIEDSADRAIWLTAAGLIAVVLGIQAASVAPFSTGRLSEKLDGLSLPFFELRTQERSGHSWCRPHCPSVLNTYSAPATGVSSAMRTVFAALTLDRVVPQSPLLPAALLSGAARVRTNALEVDVHVIRRKATPGAPIPRLTIKIRLTARRR